MSEILTRIELPGQKWSGLGEWGRVSAEEMIRVARYHSAKLRAVADAIDAAKDEDFRIESARGVHVRKNVTVIQSGIPVI